MTSTRRTGLLLVLVPMLAGARCGALPTDVRTAAAGAAATLSAASEVLTRVDRDVAAFYKRHADEARVLAAVVCGVVHLAPGAAERVERGPACWREYRRLTADIDAWRERWVALAAALVEGLNDLSTALQGDGLDIPAAAIRLARTTRAALLFEFEPRPVLAAPPAVLPPASQPVQP